VAEAEAGKPDLRLARRPEGGAREAGEFFLGGAGGGSADLLAVNEEGFAAIMLLKREDVTI